MLKKKTLSLFIFFVLQVFFLDAYGSSKKVDKKINSKDKLEIKYFPTTNVKGSLFFTLGALSESNSTESLHFTYENKIRLNTSFKGTDNLLTVFESGNAFPDSKTVNKLSVPLKLVFNLILFSYVKCKDSVELDSDSAPNVKNKLPLTFVVGKYFISNLSFEFIFLSTFFDDP